jgi:hypothetical protein
MVSDEDDSALIFISPGILPALRNCREIPIDATFRMVPGLFYQLMTLHVIAYGHVRYANNLFIVLFYRNK